MNHILNMKCNLVVPTSTGRPCEYMNSTSSLTLSHFPLVVCTNLHIMKELSWFFLTNIYQYRARTNVPNTSNMQKNRQCQ
jgi:hypothetical protein